MPHYTIVIIGAATLFLGVLISAVGFIWAIRAVLFSQKALKITGVLVGHESRESSDDIGNTSTTYAPTVQYTDAAGIPHRITMTLATAWRSQQIGEPVQLLVDPAHPDRGTIAKFSHQYLFPLILIAVGAVFSIVGLIFSLIGGFTSGS